jgi:hypothetical protein
MVKFKWLDYFKSYVTYDSFLNEMNKQIPTQFENLLGKKLEWNKVWLFVEPIGKDKIFEKIITQNGIKRVYLLTAEIRYRQCPVSIHLFWQSKDKNRWIDVTEKINGDDIIFVLESINDEFGCAEKFPSAEAEEKIFSLNTNTYFPVEMDQKNVPHEGYFIFEVESPEIPAKIKDTLYRVSNEWNMDLNINGLSLEQRGIFHDLYLDEYHDEANAFYFDIGSAINGNPHEYFLEQVGKEVKGIVKVKIESL